MKPGSRVPDAVKLSRGGQSALVLQKHYMRSTGDNLVNINPENIAAGQRLYMKRLNNLSDEIRGISKIGQEDLSLTAAAELHLDKIDIEINEIVECLKLLALLRQGA